MIAKALRVLRNPGELYDRLFQEAMNLRLLVAPPRLKVDTPPAPLPCLPHPDILKQRLSNTRLAAEIHAQALGIRQHHLPLLGVSVHVQRPIRWRRDPSSQLETGVAYFRRIPYLDASKAGDHKFIWELNRHQHLVLLAQEHLLFGTQASLDEIESQLASWLAANPFQRGINWASALEVAFRALSWIWLEHLVGSQLTPPLRQQMLQELFRHGCHLEHNLSFYFSPNTHLLGEAVALHALGIAFPAWPHAQRWTELGHRVVEEQLRRQVHNDGSHFEKSSYYHVYALDMFLFHAVLSGSTDEWAPVLRRMSEYLDSLLGPSRRLPYLGDDDGGRFFMPIGRHDEFGKATLATAATMRPEASWNWSADDLPSQAAWWLPEFPTTPGSSAAYFSRQFSDSGIAVLIQGLTQVLFDAGSFGWGPAGHSHSSALQLIVRRGPEEILIDPGTFTYVGDPARRDYFRGSAAHNTVRINGRDQATPAGPFAWKGRPRVDSSPLDVSGQTQIAEAVCAYDGFEHRRRIQLTPSALEVHDTVLGPPGDHLVEWFWHATDPVSPRLVTPDGTQSQPGARSLALGQEEPSTVLTYRHRGSLPATLTWRILL